MLIEDQQGNQLLELTTSSEDDLSKVTPLTHALVVVRHDGNKSLLVFNRYRNYWELPGGMIDAGETPRACAARELQEESGVVCVLEALRFVGVMKFLLQPDRFHSEVRLEHGALYALEVARISPFVPNDEISRVCWWDGSEAIGEISAIDRKLTELVRERP